MLEARATATRERVALTTEDVAFKEAVDVVTLLLTVPHVG